MRAVRVHGLHDIRIDEVPEPGKPGPSEILVAPRWGGLCGTDVKEYVGPVGSVPDQPHPLTGACKPLILGHEFSAHVVSVGSAIANVRPGDRVAVMPLHYCGTASPRRGRESEEHTSELQSHSDLVCRLLLEKKKKTRNNTGENDW